MPYVTFELKEKGPSVTVEGTYYASGKKYGCEVSDETMDVLSRWQENGFLTILSTQNSDPQPVEPIMTEAPVEEAPVEEAPAPRPKKGRKSAE